MFTLAKLTADDAPPYRALMLEAYAQPGDAFTSTAEERAALPLSWWAQRAAAADGSGLALGAWVDNTLVGSVALEFSSRAKTRHRAHLVGMYVQPAHQGQGMARALMQAALAEAAARPGVRWVALHRFYVVREQQGTGLAGRLMTAIAFYRKCGFEAVGHTTFDVGADRQRDWVMVGPTGG